MQMTCGLARPQEVSRISCSSVGTRTIHGYQCDQIHTAAARRVREAQETAEILTTQLIWVPLFL